MQAHAGQGRPTAAACAVGGRGKGIVVVVGGVGHGETMPPTATATEQESFYALAWWSICCSRPAKQGTGTTAGKSHHGALLIFALFF